MNRMIFICLVLAACGGKKKEDAPSGAADKTKAADKAKPAGPAFGSCVKKDTECMAVVNNRKTMVARIQNENFFSIRFALSGKVKVQGCYIAGYLTLV